MQEVLAAALFSSSEVDNEKVGRMIEEAKNLTPGPSPAKPERGAVVELLKVVCAWPKRINCSVEFLTLKFT